MSHIVSVENTKNSIELQFVLTCDSNEELIDYLSIHCADKIDEVKLH